MLYILTSLHLHKGQNASKLVLLKNWNCFKISRIWRNSHLFDMHFSQKFQWVLLLQDCFNIKKCDPMLMPKILLLTKIILKTFKKKKEDSSCLPFVIFSMLWSWFTSLCHASSDTICSKDKNFEFYNWFPTFWDKKWNLLLICHYSLLLFTVTIHLLLFMTLFPQNFAYFEGGCPLYFKQVFSVLSSGFLS